MCICLLVVTVIVEMVTLVIVVVGLGRAGGRLRRLPGAVAEGHQPLAQSGSAGR